MIYSPNFQYSHICLASPEQIRSWAERQLPNGEIVGHVTQPHTVDYQTHKPEKDGLFCERIFGPIKSNVCACGKYQGATDNEDRPKFCEECGVELTESQIRRYRMGYIELECSLTHPWYFKQRPNYIARLLNQPSKYINSLIYYDTCLIRAIVDKPTLLFFVAEQSPFYKQQKEPIFSTPLELFSFDHAWEKSLESLFSAKWFKILKEREIVTGGDAIKNLLQQINLKRAIQECCAKWDILTKEKADKYSQALLGNFKQQSLNYSIEDDLFTEQNSLHILCRRLILLKNILNAQILPEWMVLSCLSVLPPALRPMVELKQGQFITSDLNSLYQIVIYRNNRLSWVKKTASPDLVLNMQKRLLQQGVDALLSNGTGSAPLTDKHWRPYKSFSDIIKGKKGRFRENLLGKRVDYSGRSVIVVGPSLSLNQCGLPKEMAVELFQPFIIRKLIVTGAARNFRVAKIMLKNKFSVIWKILTTILQEHLIILNRAPTLHRLGMQAFQPILVKGRAIHLHPLVCTGFNADFDGDQMAVHVPLSLEAQSEARMLMLPFLNLLSPATGEAVTVPSQDMLLGLYILTLEHNSIIRRETNLHGIENRKCLHLVSVRSPSFSKYSDVLTAYHQGFLSCHSRIWLRWIHNAWVINSIARQTPVEIQYESIFNITQLSVYECLQIRNNKKQGVLSLYIRTTVGRILFNQQIEQALQASNSTK